VLVAEPGTWFAYRWFEKPEAPDYAAHVDIHNKPGYDPCELFFNAPPLGWPLGSVSMDTKRIHGSHGNVGPGYEVAWTSSLSFSSKPASLLDLSHEVKRWMSAEIAAKVA
jgi:hypothetical protein